MFYLDSPKSSLLTGSSARRIAVLMHTATRNRVGVERREVVGIACYRFDHSLVEARETGVVNCARFAKDSTKDTNHDSESGAEKTRSTKLIKSTLI